MAKTIFEEMGGTYVRQGDYFIPCLSLPADKENHPIGVWGQRHKRYLQEHKKATYTTLLTSGKLNSYLADIDEQAEEWFSRMVRQMALPCGGHRDADDVARRAGGARHPPPAGAALGAGAFAAG